MSWENVDLKLEERTLSYFVFCNDDREMNYLKKIILEEFPEFDEKQIIEAMAECCRELITPRTRHRYLKQLQRKLFD